MIVFLGARRHHQSSSNWRKKLLITSAENTFAIPNLNL
jgi:hypothetical protein